MASKRPVLHHDLGWYDVTTLKSEKEMRKEYARLREVARKRLARMEGTPAVRSQAYKMNRFRFDKPQSQIKSAGELSRRLSDLSRFINAKSSTVRGQRELRAKSLETLHEHGYTFVNEKNIYDFGEFMEWWRSYEYGRLYNSDMVADLFAINTRLKMPLEELESNFLFFMETRDELDEVASVRKSENRTALEYTRRVEDLKRKKRKRKG